MSFIIDTDICSALMRGNGKVFNRFIQHTGGLYITTLTLAELNTFVHPLVPRLGAKRLSKRCSAM